MKRSLLLPASYLLDWIAGDPEWFPHPVRIMGLAIAQSERILRWPKQSAAAEMVSGTILTGAGVAAAYQSSTWMLNKAYRRSHFLGCAVETVLGWTCLAARGLEREASSVHAALATGDLPLARTRLRRIVGRDTERLDRHEIGRALVETLAESASDGVIAPMLAMALGGVPLAMAYKAVNTLDSMIGHADARYFYFGKSAARLDDAANYLPARITAVAIVAAAAHSGACDARSAWRTWRRDGGKHKSPNAGQPESAMAGALQVRLGGDNTYAGEVVPAQYIGEEFAPPESQDAARAIRLVSAAALLGLALSVLLAAARRRGRGE